MPRFRSQQPAHPKALPMVGTSAAPPEPSNVTRALRLPGPGRVADLLAVQSAAGNAATAALVGQARTLQRVRLEEAEPLFRERYPSGKDANYLNDKRHGADRRARIAEPAESVEHLGAILDKVTVQDLDKFVKTVQDASRPSVGSIGAIIATASNDLPPAELAALRLRHIYRVAAEDGLDLAGLQNLHNAIKGLSGAQLQERDDSDRKARQEAREKLRLQQERKASADRAVGEAVKLGVPKEVAGALCYTVAGGQELLEGSFEILRHPLCIGKRGVLDILGNTAGSQPDEHEGRVRGGLYEFSIATERLRQGHIIQMGNLAISEALRKIRALKDVREDSSHPSHGAVRYLDNAGSIISEEAKAGADIIDWTTLVVIQAKTTQGRNQTIVDHIVKAIEQVAGRYSEWPMTGVRTRLQALVRIDRKQMDLKKQMDFKALLSDPKVLRALRNLHGDTLSVLSLAINIGDGMYYFVPKKAANGWLERSSDPAEEKW